MDIFEGLLAAASAAVELADDETLYHQGDRVEDVYLISDGYMKFTELDASGSATITAILSAGQVFGEGLGDAKTASQTASAKGCVMVHRFSRGRFKQLIGEAPELAAGIIAMLTQRQRLIERRLQAVLHLDVRARIVLLLNDMTKHYGGRCEHGHEVDVPLTQQELSELVGASRPVVSSRLNDLRREGLLDYSRGYICVDSRQVLGALATSVNPAM